MSGKQIELTAVARATGKHNSRALRNQRLIPAVAYGPKVENINFSITENDVKKYSSRQYENEIFVLKSDDKNLDGIKVLKKDMSIHPVSRRPVHLDFFVPDMTQTVKVDVEIKYEGTPKGTKEGGIFNILMRTVEVECLPSNIPESFSVDVSGLGLNEVLHVSALPVSGESIKVLTSSEETLATVAQAKEETAATTTEEAAADAPAADDKK